MRGDHGHDCGLHQTLRVQVAIANGSLSLDDYSEGDEDLYKEESKRIAKEKGMPSLVRLGHGAVGALALWLGQAFYGYVRRPAPRCGARCDVGSYAGGSMHCVNSCKRAKHHLVLHDCMQHDFDPWQKTHPVCLECAVRRSRVTRADAETQTIVGLLHSSSSSEASQDWSTVNWRNAPSQEPQEEDAVNMIHTEDEHSEAILANIEAQGGWRQFNYDTGAAMTVFPKRELNESMLRELKTNGKNYRSACGKVVPDLGGSRITGYSESGILRTVKARVAEVQKPLVSASQTADKVTAWIARKGQRSYVIPSSRQGCQQDSEDP